MLPNKGNTTPIRSTIKPTNPAQNLVWGVPKPALDTSVAGTHIITYSSRDASGHVGTATRTVIIVEDASLPILTLNEVQETLHELGTAFEDPGATVTAGDGTTILETKHPSVGSIDINTSASKPSTTTTPTAMAKSPKQSRARSRLWTPLHLPLP